MSNRSVPRRRFAVALLALVLNVALVPCTMAIEIVEESHDCCPPELRLEASDCCEVDDGSVAPRSGAVEIDDTDDATAVIGYADLLAPPTSRNTGAVDPPDPPLYRLDLNALYCVYLK